MNFSFQRNGTFSEMSPLSRNSSNSTFIPQSSPFLSRSNSSSTNRTFNSPLQRQSTHPITRSQSIYSSYSRHSTIVASPSQSCQSSFTERSIKVSVRLKSPANWDYTQDSLLVDSREYQFDHIITEQNHIMYEKTCQDTIEKLINGQNATIFTYGATNSGKTFSMYGSETQDGIVPIALDTLFEHAAVFQIAFYEIYNETVRDLLMMGESTKTPNLLRVKSLHHLKMIMSNGSRYQHVEGTEWNTSSTRGHVVLQIYMTKESGFTNSQPTTCVLNMIDLAGSEKLSMHGKRRREGAFINKSLLTLGTVISKLGSTKGHVPFRDSKLTTILQPFLQAGSNISVILCLGEDQGDSLNTLAFGMRLKDMKPRKQVDKYNQHEQKLNLESKLKIKELEDEIKRITFEAESDRAMWDAILQDMYQEKNEMKSVIDDARRKMCGVVEIDGDSVETLDDLINAVIAKMSWDMNQIHLN